LAVVSGNAPGCAILRATQISQSLRLTFLQLLKLWRADPAALSADIRWLMRLRPAAQLRPQSVNI
jgi:hypothetical protein